MNSLQFYKLNLVFIYVLSLYKENNPETKSVLNIRPNLFDKTLKKKDCSEIHALLLYIFFKRLLTFFSLFLSYDIIAGWNGLH